MYSTYEAREQSRRWRNFDAYMEGRREGKHYYADYRPGAVRENQKIGGPNVCTDNKGRNFIAMEIPQYL